jgi:16S rRNA (guanine527-N7)-methyltransferase
MVEKHYVDSLLPLKLLGELPSPLMDLGSGAGLPGIPLAIASPGTIIKLVEGRRVRAGFLSRVVAELGLENVEVIGRKLNPSDRIPVAGVITRAFGEIREILRIVDRSLPPGGMVILMKGPRVEEELRGLDLPSLGYTLVEEIEYLLPIRKDHRILVVLQKQEQEEKKEEEEGATPKLFFIPSKGEVRMITSRENPLFKRWKKLLKGRGVHKFGETLLFGRNYLRDLLSDPPPEILGIILREGEEDLPEGGRLLPRFILSAPLFDSLDFLSARSPIAWLKTRPLPPWDPSRGKGVGVVLTLQNPLNLGGALRTIAGVGIQEVIVLPETASPFHPKSLRGSGPLPYRIPIYTVRGVEEISNSGVPVYLLDPRGEPISRVHLPSRFLLVLGSEGQGAVNFPKELARLSVPMAEPGLESFNATVALALALSRILGFPKDGLLQESS